MCDVGLALAAGSFLIEGASTLAGAGAQNKQSKANKAAAENSLRIQRNDLSVRQIEETVAAEQQIEAGSRQARQATSAAKVGAVEAGVAGMSVDALLGTIAGDEARFDSSVKQNLTVTLDQLERMKSGAEAQAQSRINSVPTADPFAETLKIGSAALDFGTRIQSRKPKGY